MNSRKLNSGICSLIALITMAIWLSACNNEDAANNSTRKDSATGSLPDSSNPATISTVTAKAAKKGKATVSVKAEEAAAEMKMDKEGYYNHTEIPAAYQGSLEDYITNNIEYPQDAIDNNMEGTVQVRFGIDETGSISNVSTVGNKLGYGLEEEAIRVVSRMPNWAPGKVKNKNVKSWRMLPITYKLEL